VWGARRAGLKAVWVANDRVAQHDVTPDGVIDRLSELPALVESLTTVS